MVLPTPKRMMWRVYNGGSLENVAKVFVLFLCGVQLVLRSGVLTVLDFDEVFGSVLSGVDGSAGGCWRCCWRCCWPPGVLPVSLNCPLPLRRTHSPALFSKLLFFCFCSDGSNQHKTWAAGGKSVFIWEAGWEEPFGNKSTFGCFRNLEILHGHPFVAAYIFGDNA